MTDCGMTPEGFVPKRLADILADLNAGIADIADPESGEFPFQNVSDDSILQQILGVFAAGLSECWEAAYEAAVQFDPLKNTGAGQAGTIQLNAMLLKAGSATIVRLRLKGKAGTFVPGGSQVAGADGKQVYAIVDGVTIAATGQAEVEARCTEKGPFAPAANTIINIRTPVSGWFSATNIVTLSVGTAQETEEEARRRQQRSTSLTSYRQIEAVYAAVMNVPGVIYCRAYQNDKTYPEDERGIPFKEVAVVAEGGDAAEIAAALFLRFPLGVVGHGNTTEVFYDAQGISYPISFSRPREIRVAVAVDVTVTNRAEFPDTGADLIRQAIVEYAAYGGNGNEDGFPPGADIVCSRLYTPVNSVAGHKVTRLAIAVAPGAGLPAFSGADIPVAWDEVGRFALGDIAVTVNSV